MLENLEIGKSAAKLLMETMENVQRLAERRRAKWLETGDTFNSEDIVWSL